MEKQAKIIDSSIKGGILTVSVDKFIGKVGDSLDLDFPKYSVSGEIFKKVGKTLKIRVSKILEKGVQNG